ncbi:A disintegrin and metalloproteinase with thrombospondin motifs 7 isoform X1 [Danio rerio]|uniref:A disintegrin and metalloproteinase with thrombospondin motifs 7 isoform X1 n=1 Tax=Danio rerio TaxID=7955 RepID=A0A8M9QD44_DANRE|nr:A disintegrin and metalloproteinase with thrombospondin motifs 7 [Danio rerio]|eukprot:XP_021333676.1 A disintegrin and metalloproteinase with thrombospondin motifs 7 [Danio rerio]
MFQEGSVLSSVQFDMMVPLDCGIKVLGPATFSLYFVITAGLISVIESTTSIGYNQDTDGSLSGVPSYEVVYPIRVDSSGHFLSNLVSHRVSRIQRRETEKSKERLTQVYYYLQYGGQDLHFNLTLNPHLLAPGFLTERRYGGLQGSTLHGHGHSLCFFLGDVWSSMLKSGQAAVSTCNGLTGLFKLSEEEFFISPLEQEQEESTTQAHAIYKRHAVQSERQLVQPLFGEHTANATCGVKGGAEQFERQRERWESRQQRKRIRQRSISTEKWVETLVVADPKMVEYHGSKGVVSYVLSVMNIVAGLFRDASIGNAINIAVVRLVLLEKDEEDLKITHHADNSLHSFCKWQKNINMKDDDHPVHHDVAVLITRKDICAAINKPCETLGLSHVAGMCQPHRSCSINEDTGLPLAFTIAHELGHNFGIQHDGNGNDCEPIGKRPFVMSPQLLYGTSPPNWSRCSREYITRFLDRGWGWCLDDPPVRNELDLHPAPPGVLYSAAHQCKLQYGSSSLLCDEVDNICSTLWCTVGSTCHSRLDGAVDGTKCGEDKWCFDGECVTKGTQPESVHGGWASWSDWSDCSRTCGTGVQNAQRDCINPVPKYGGRYCLGERQRYRTCNHESCPVDQPSFRHMQCSRFNTVPYKGKFYKWIHVNNRVNPCELHCRPMNEHFSERMLDTVIDGTQCYEGSQSRDICVNGICKYLGCDFEIDSDAVEDQCGVCLGNGSTCETVRKTFEDSEGLGYVDIGLIPEGARDIRIEEVAEAGNYLALRSNDPEKYFLNGGWTIQWNGEYKAAGTIFTYERTGQLENLSSPGPTMEPVWIQLLFQETNPGVRYEYTISRDTLLDSSNGTAVSYFQWIYGAWTECSATCGTGMQRQIVHCVEKTSGIVEEHYCDASMRPDDKQTSCNKGLCPAIWWAGDWQKCSSSCGEMGLRKRTVLCIRSLGLDEQRALQPAECQHLPKPESIIPCNTQVSCPADWTTGSWSECSVSCATGLRIRDVTCRWNTGSDCDPKAKPNSTMPCYAQDCPINTDISDWSGSGASSKEVFNEIDVIPHDGHFSQTKNQPRQNADLNDIVENDFSHYNHIEKSPENSIVKNLHVDDFYYDYNFIKFHEDLSYDLDEDDAFDNSGIKHKDLTGTYVSNTTTSSPSTTADQHSTATMYSDSITKGTEGHKPPNKGIADDNNDALFAEDYLLPVITTTEPTSSVTRLFNKLKASGTDSDLMQDISVTRNPLSTADVSLQNENEFVSDTFLTPEPDLDSKGNLNNEDDYDDELKDTTKIPIPEDENEEFGEDVPGGESEWESFQPPSFTQPYEPPLDYIFQFETYENSAVQNPTTPLHWNMASPTVSTTRQSNLLSSVSSNDFTKHEPTTNSETSEPWPAVREFTVTSNSLSQEFSPTSSIPAKHYSSMTSEAGTTALPPTEMESDFEPPIFTPVEIPDTIISAETYDWYSTAIALTKNNGPRTEPWGTTVPLPRWTEIDNNEVIIGRIPRPSGLNPTLFTPTEQPSQGTSSEHSVHSSSPLMPTGLVMASLSPSASPAHWNKGNWSACSTSCGLGAIWRTVSCSSGDESDCDLATRPVPARRCYLRPCSAWNIGEWSKCSKNCGVGVKVREIQCHDTRDQRSLRPFHCQATSPRPPVRIPCNIHSCLDWYTSSWGQCSEMCGGGEQQRLVTCPETGRCDEDLQPSSIQSCNVHPCNQWITGSWGQCSVSCGGGIQRRLVKCVNTKAELEDENEHVDCEHDPRPNNTKKCNVHDCDSAPSGQLCLRDLLTLRFCQTLHWLGRCQVPSVRVKCCKTCSLPPRGSDRTTSR